MRKKKSVRRYLILAINSVHAHHLDYTSRNYICPEVASIGSERAIISLRIFIALQAKKRAK